MYFVRDFDGVVTSTGVLEIIPEGYGFLRSAGHKTQGGSCGKGGSCGSLSVT
jgi:transcription termination factor Rho